MTTTVTDPIGGMVLRAETEAPLLAAILRDAHNTTMTMTVGGRIVLIANEIAIESAVEIATMIKILAKIVTASEIATGDIAMIDTAALDTRLIHRGQTVIGIRVGVGGTTSCQSPGSIFDFFGSAHARDEQ